MLPFIVGAVALGLLSRESRGSNPNQLIIELDTALPAPEVEQVIGAIRVATPATVAQLDAMSNAYRQRGMPLTAYELARRAWDVRGRQGPPPQAPHPDAGAPQGLPPTSPPVGCLDAAADPAMCQAVTGALLTETNPDKLHAFAETLRAQFPQAAEALDSKAIVFGWTGPGGGGSNGAHTNGHANGHAAPYANGDASHADGAAAPQAPSTPQSWVQVASDMSNVPPQYHGSLATMMMQLGRDDSMAQGSERAVQVGDRMFVFVKPPAGPNVTAGTVWITRMSVGPDQQTASTGYGSGPLWPVDILNSRMIPPDRRIMGSPTIWDPASSILSPPAPVQTMMMQGPPGPAVQQVYVSGEGMGEQPSMHAPQVMHPMSGGQMAVGGSMDDGEPMQMSVPGAAMAAAVAAMPPGAAFGEAGVREIMGASRPEIVSSGQAGAEEMAKDAALIEQQMHAEIEAQMQHAAMMEHVAMQQHAAAVQAAAAAEQAAQPPMPDRRATERPRPSVYVKLKHGDSVWPHKIAKIGSGNKNNYDQLVAMNPHLVSPTGAWRQMVPGDEVCIPPGWAQNLRDRGFRIMSDFEGN